MRYESVILYLTFSNLAFANVIRRQSCVALWNQCGGTYYSGPTCCVSGAVCTFQKSYYSQCIPSTASSVTTTSPKTTTTTTKTTTTTTSISSLRTQSPYPAVDATSCGAWVLKDNVCCPAYCSNNNKSEDCSSCGGLGSAQCITPDSQTCKSGSIYPEVHAITGSEDWKYSRSTHFGLTSGGACGFGLYALCTKKFKWSDNANSDVCTAFCAAYPALCQDPSDITLRGNFAAPNGNYYSQFWPSLPGDRDNYLSCGECYEVIRTKPDGTDYQVGESGYTNPIVLEIVDSCPCSANSKWCCGPAADHCGEIGFKYGCPLNNGSIHLDLSDIAMARLQTGDPNGNMVDGVIPTRYKRVSCPKPGNVFVWLRSGAGPYYFALTVVNAAGIGSVVDVQISADSANWTSLKRDPNYTSSRPQERYGSWVVPQGAGPFNPPVAMRIVSGAGEVITNSQFIKSYTPPSNVDANYWYLDFGAQFTK